MIYIYDNYIIKVVRTLVDIPARLIDILADICRTQNISRAEAIRRSIQLYIRQQGARSSKEDAFGIWRDRDEDGLSYTRGLRSEWTEDDSSI